MMGNVNGDDRAMKVEEVCRYIGMSRAWWYRQLSEGKAPQPIRIGVKAVRWRKSAIDRYLRERAAESGIVEDQNDAA